MYLYASVQVGAEHQIDTCECVIRDTVCRVCYDRRYLPPRAPPVANNRVEAKGGIRVEDNRGLVKTKKREFRDRF